MTAVALTWVALAGAPPTQPLAAAASAVPSSNQDGVAGPHAIHLPVTLASSTLYEGPLPTAAATDTPPPPTATDTPQPSPTPTVFVCPPLSRRVEVSEIDVSPSRVNTRPQQAAPWSSMPIYLAQLPDGSGSIAGWADTTGRVHLTQLDRDFQRAEPDIVLDGEEIRGLAPHFDGTALLVVRGDSLYVVRVESDGTVRYDKRLIGGESHSRPGSKWVDDWGHEARLVWDGERYGVYAGHTQYFGSKGKHQGDLFWYLDSEGERIVRDNDGDWDWGCSHSLDLRLAYNGTRFGPVCLSDSYPSKGFHFAHREAEIRKEPSGDAHGRSDANLGGWVPLEDGFLMSFSSPEGRASSDVGVVFVHNDAWVGDVHWLTDTRGVDESGPHLAAYDEQFLAGWTSGRSHTIAVVDRDGSIIDGPVEIEATIQDKDDMVTMLDGSVAWAFVDGNASRLKVAQVMSCRPEAWPTTEPQPTAPASATPGGPGGRLGFQADGGKILHAHRTVHPAPLRRRGKRF